MFKMEYIQQQNVPGRQSKVVKPTVFQSAFAGAMAGATTRAITQPLDVLKVRFQLQTEPIKRGSKYSSIFQAVRTIIKEEGIMALWSGHVPAQVLSITYGIIQFSTFEMLIQFSEFNDPLFYESHKHRLYFAFGSTAAAAATVVSFPFDTVRTRLIAEQKTQKAYKGFCNALITMIKKEGPYSLYKGLLPTVAQIAPNAGIQFGTYKLLTDKVLNKIEFFQRPAQVNRVMESTLSANLLAGSISGFLAKTAIYPFDLVKKRLQIQGFQQYRKAFGKQIYCTGAIQCVMLTITREGIFGLYKGYWPSMLKAVSVSALHFGVYDEIKYFLLQLQK